MLSYEGLFILGEDLDKVYQNEGTNLGSRNDELHCTFKYHPSEEEIFDELVGKEFIIYLIGYACDGKNSGFEISLPEELIPYYINMDDEGVLKTPHITVSLSEDAKAYNTVKLPFKALDEPIPIRCRFGYWIKIEDKVNEYLTFDPYTQGPKKR